MFGVVVIVQIVELAHTVHSQQERLIIFVLGLAPLNFAQSSKTRKYHILSLLESRNIFRP